MTMRTATSSRRRITLLLLAAAALIVVVVIWHAGQTPTPARPAEAPATTANPANTPAPAGPSEAAPPAPADPAPQAFPPADPGYPVPPGAGELDGPITDQALQILLDQHSDVEPALRKALTRIGAQVITADLTTTGASDLARTWPQLWPAGPPNRATVADFHLHAITARTDPLGYRVLAVYSGTDPVTGEAVDHAPITVPIQRTLEGYLPVAP